MMSKLGIAIALILTIGYFPVAQCLDYEYRALFQVGGQITGNVTTRQTDISATVQTLLGEAAFTYNTVTAVLETLTSTVSNADLVVNFAFTNASASASQLTTILEGIGIFTNTIDGFGVNATDYDECLTNNGNCSATCTNTAGSFVCSCAEQYIASGTLCDLPFSFACDPTGITLSAVKSFFTNVNIDNSSLKLGTCQGTDNGTFFNYAGQCGANITTNGSHVTLSWVLTNVNPSAKYETGTVVTYPLSCTLQSSYNVTAAGFNGTVQLVEIADNILVSVSSAAPFDVAVFDNPAMDNPVSGAIAAGSPLNFLFGPTSSISPNVYTVIESCSASPTGNPSLKIDLVSNGCRAAKTGTNNDVIDGTSLPNNGQGSQVAMSTQAFFFSESSLLTMSFSLRLCDSSGGASCAPSCSKRKRSVLNMRARRDIGDTAEITVQFVRDPDDTLCKDKDCGSGACIADAKLNEFCLCPRSSYVGSDGKCIDPAGNDINTSVQENSGGLNGFNNVWLFVLIGLASLAVLLVIALSLILMRKRYSSSNDKQLIM